MTFYTDACFVPSCQYQDFSELQGKTCLEATLEIVKKYPGITVLCLKETDSSPTDDNFERFIVVTDSSGKVVRVVFNRVFDCPAESPVMTGLSYCKSYGQKCIYTYASDALAGEQCETTDTCTCLFNAWQCDSVVTCI